MNILSAAKVNFFGNKSYISQLSETKDEPAQKSLLQKTGEIMGEIMGDNLEVTDAETTWEVNLALMKFKRTVKQKKKED